MKEPPPLQPESPEEMRARFPKVLEVVFETPEHVPTRDHYFDFPDGMRICVTLERENGVERHVSVSMLRDTQLWKEAKARDGFGFVSQMLFKLLAEDRYRSISGDTKPLKFDGVSKSSGVPHWRRPE